MEIGNVLAVRKGQTAKGAHYEIIITDKDADNIFEKGVYVNIFGKTERAGFTSVENTKWIQGGEWAKKTSSAYITGDAGQLALRIEGGVIALNEEEAKWVRANSNRKIRRFHSETDLETGITYYTIYTHIPTEDWKKIAHLFERGVELDCPESSEWNDSITLKWATRQPEKVAEILGWEFED